MKTLDLTKNIVLVGKTASGKDTLRFELEEHGFNTWRRRTTRPRRPGETDEYLFCDEYEESDTEIVHSIFNDWHFVLDTRDKPREPFVVIVAPRELSQIMRLYPDSRLVYLDIDRETRAQRLVDRGDCIYEIRRRMLADDRDFKHLDIATRFFKRRQHLHARSREEVFTWLTIRSLSFATIRSYMRRILSLKR